MEERIPQPREKREPTVAEPAPTTFKPSDDDGVALAPAVQLLSPSLGEESSDDEGEMEFEFPFVSRDSPAGTAAPADELFADGRIRTFYPVFGRGAGCVARGNGCTALPAAPAAEPRVRGQLGKLFLAETRERNSSTSSTSSSSSSSSSLSVAGTDDDGLEGAAPESYCVWRPAPSASASPRPTPPRKSGSTGSMARWRRISDLVVGRSHSDGREKFLFLAATPPPHDAPRRHRKPAPAPATGAFRKPPPPPAPAKEADAAAVANHRIAYLARGGLGGGVPVPVPPVGTPRRTFLPYREELVGFFANVNGISRSHHHPF